ncbi:ABC transporter permease [Ruminococcus flavefaciens]|uniref:Uncharacterized protein n=1 Tax=Ruminococcus flavefaciens 007c TaxID=1341157 RepID=W7USA5_RUMFL|nr:ABC transporter permease [Ruminococcus flavefaciens]EWM54264.1 hypothetical protein RF007C_11685 [Ruminococcus flavefaciens 007c]
MLFAKECRKISGSLVFWIYCIIIALMFLTQYFSDCTEREYPPSPGRSAGDYDFKPSGDHDTIIEGTVNSLINDYYSNKYICYPLGFYKAVHLKDKDQEKIEAYITEITGLDHDKLAEIKNNCEEYYVSDGVHEYKEYKAEHIDVDTDNISYDRFREIISDIDSILGGGSDYAPESAEYNFSMIPMTYEDALEEYNELFEKDGIAGAYARLFSDYLGIVLGIMPVFVAIAIAAADRRSRMDQLIFSRSISSFRLVFTRYAALITMMFIPVLTEIIASVIQLLVIYNGESVAVEKMLGIPVFWLLPNLMVSAALGMLLTEMFSGGTAIVVQFAVWFMSIMRGGTVLSGNIRKFTLVCRHNTLYNRAQFMLHKNDFIFNRTFYFIASLAAVAVTAFVFEMKRGGRFNGIRLFGKDGILRRKA